MVAAELLEIPRKGGYVFRRPAFDSGGIEAGDRALETLERFTHVRVHNIFQRNSAPTSKTRLSL